jgi:hypothetical protein
LALPGRFKGQDRRAIKPVYSLWMSSYSGLERKNMDDNDETTAEKLSQNIQALVGEIGELQVLLRLSILAQQTDWEVFHNLGEAGYDILLLNSKTLERIRIEVKTRQKLYTTGKLRRTVQFFLTDGEYQACDCLIAYFLDRNEFYIVPKEDLAPSTARGHPRWRLTLGFNKKGDLSKSQAKYLNKWRFINADFEKGESIFAN